MTWPCRHGPTTSRQRDRQAKHTGGGRNPANQLICGLSHYLQGFIHFRWLSGISEPSTVAMNNPSCGEIRLDVTYLRAGFIAIFLELIAWYYQRLAKHT